MAELNQSNIENIRAAIRENSDAIAQSLNRCFDSDFQLQPGESFPWGMDVLAGEFDGPGICVFLRVGGNAVVCLISASLPLPDWYAHPGEGERSKLQTLGREWSTNMLPADLPAEEFHAEATGDLKTRILTASLAEWAVVQELLLYADSPGADPEASENSSGEEAPSAPAGRILVIWPIPQPGPSDADATTDSAERSHEEAPAAESPTPVQHLMKMPVTVMVRLAEKRIQLGTLLSLTPGALITFNKSCEDLLDFYVNNQLCGRGEAVKIDEKFGLKVSQVNITEQERKPAVLQ